MASARPRTATGPTRTSDEALAVTGKRIKASEWLMDDTEWDLFATV